jgi:uncharacterized protein YcbK (DUF882 family)
MNRILLRRRDLILAAGLTLVFGTTANAALWIEGGTYIEPKAAPRRRLILRHAHTGETFAGFYRDDKGPIAEAMVDLALFLRDHHENKMGPVYVETLDFLADVIEASGQWRATVLSAYRTERTNAMLAARIFGVAEKSQHLAGRAIDITLDAKLNAAAKIARKMARGGTGWYPRSHFIHLDSGPIRYWTINAAGGDKILTSFRPERIVETGQALKRPLTVKERLRLQRELARKQARDRAR